MKALFKSFVILALLHFFLILGFVGWMFGTGRLDERRLTDLRMMVTETIADRDKREAEEQAAIEVYDARHKAWREDADAAKVQKV